LTNIGASNGLLRQYFPKSSDLSAYSADDLDWVAAELNDRPRKRLGFKNRSNRSDPCCCVDRQNPPTGYRSATKRSPERSAFRSALA
jgi:hypothetical protein